MNLRKTQDQLNKKIAICEKYHNIYSQNCLHIYRKNLVSYKIALVNYM